MNNNLIWLLAFLLGLFIIISLFILQNIFTIEHFEDPKKKPSQSISAKKSSPNNSEKNNKDPSKKSSPNNSEKNNKDPSKKVNSEIKTKLSAKDAEHNDINDTSSTGDIIDAMEQIIASSSSGKVASVLPNLDKKKLQMPVRTKMEAEIDSENKCYSQFRNPEVFTHNELLDKIPFNNELLMHITTYNEEFPKILEKNIWYDEINTSEGLDEENDRKWFRADKMIDYQNYENIIKSAKLNGIELSGPMALKFSSKENNSLEQFSIFLITKIKDIDINNFQTLFEFGLETTDKDSLTMKLNMDNNNENKFNWGMVNLEIVKGKKDCDYSLIASLGAGEENKYSWHKIDTRLLINKNILIGLICTGNKIRIILDNLFKEFPRKNSDLILGSNKLKLNKGGNINMELHSFAFYNKVFNDSDIDLYIKYNNYYINKLHELNIDNKKANDELNKCNIEKSGIIDTLQTKLLNVEKELDTCNKEYANILDEFVKEVPHEHELVMHTKEYDKTLEYKKDLMYGVTP